MDSNKNLRNRVETLENTFTQILAEFEGSRNQMHEGMHGAGAHLSLSSSDQRPDGDENRYWEDRFRRLVVQFQALESTLEQTNETLHAKETEFKELKRKLQDIKTEKANLESQVLNLNQKNQDMMQQIDLLRDIEHELNSRY